MASFDRYKKFVKHNGVRLFLLEATSLLACKLRAYLYRRIFTEQPGKIGPNPHIRGLSQIRIQAGFSCGRDTWLEALVQHHGMPYTPHIELGRNVQFNNDVHIAAIDRVSIGDDVLIGSRVYIGDHNHGAYTPAGKASSHVAPARRRLYSKGPIAIGRRVWIGDGVVITGGVTVGDGAVIAANTVVTKDVPANAVFAGVPGKPIGYYQ